MTYNFTVSDFEGPLDLLLHLVKESKMNIYEINIRTIIDQYLDFIHSLEEKNIDTSSEYLVMAAELIHLKSKLLVNRQDEEEKNDDEFSINSEEDLRTKLLEYEKYKEITKNFQELEEKRSEVYTKLPESLKEFVENQGLTKGELDISDLYNAYRSFIERQKLDKPLNTKITKKELNVDDKIKEIRDILNIRKKINFVELFTVMTKENIVVTFLSILEMTKNKEILLTQNDNFSPIMIERCE
ncbi:MAG TPA: segregation/condensation protein A [Firmicutes bacterium]|nr:segregation/condensation protein A [Bacillota bacterium]